MDAAPHDAGEVQESQACGSCADCVGVRPFLDIGARLRNASLVDEPGVRGYTHGMCLGESRAPVLRARFLPMRLEASRLLGARKGEM